MGKHESLIKLLLENGAEITSGNVGNYACAAVEQNNLELLKDIVRYGGDVTLPKSDDTTALHTAVSEGNAEIVKFLLQQGADSDKRDSYGWSPRALAEHQGHEEIMELFQNKSGVKKPTTAPMPKDPPLPRLVKFQSEPTIPPYVRDGRTNSETQWLDDTRIRRVNNFPNSLFGIMSAANTGERDKDLAKPAGNLARGGHSKSKYPARVTLSCPEKSASVAKLVLVPESLQQLLDIGAKKFQFCPTKVLTKEGAEIEDIELVRDGDHLVLVGDGA